ncbi:MAG TPA: PorP/SprF family type IX secretion system membrane protein [Prolixibacteraceae bacterium]|jgi:type IX secretion system PorP/SprF family membrane protein
MMLLRTGYLKIAVILIGLFIACAGNLCAQDPYFSQYYMNPTYMNPAYAGTMKVPRFGVQYRNQWPGMNNAYTTYFASFDTYLPKISSGIGLLMYQDSQGDGIYTQSSFKVLYSKEIQINREWKMLGSLSAGAQMNALHFNRLIFPDGLNVISGEYLSSGETVPENSNAIFADFGAGLLAFNGKYFFGLAADHLSEPNQSIYSAYPFVLLRKYTAHFEVNIPWHIPGHWRKFCTFNPNVIVQSQGNEQNITLGLYANRKGFSLGMWTRQTTRKSTDAIFMAGFMRKQMKTAITYDTNLRGVGLGSHGAVEISISFLLKDPGMKSLFPFYEIPGEWELR